MYCSKCGHQLDADAQFCPDCGAKTIQPFSSSEEDLVPPFPLETRQEFYKFYASRKTTGWTTTLIVICFLSAAVSLIYLCLGSYLSVLDISIYLITGILLLCTKYWVYALIPTVYSCFASLLSLIYGGSFSGIFAIIAGIICTSSLVKVNRAYQDYLYYGTGPKYDI